MVACMHAHDQLAGVVALALDRRGANERLQMLECPVVSHAGEKIVKLRYFGIACLPLGEQLVGGRAIAIQSMREQCQLRAVQLQIIAAQLTPRVVGVCKTLTFEQKDKRANGNEPRRSQMDLRTL